MVCKSQNSGGLDQKAFEHMQSIAWLCSLVLWLNAFSPVDQSCFVHLCEPRGVFGVVSVLSAHPGTLGNSQISAWSLPAECKGAWVCALLRGLAQRRPTYADHGLDFRMKRDAQTGDQGESRTVSGCQKATCPLLGSPRVAMGLEVCRKLGRYLRRSGPSINAHTVELKYE